jgi:hypothetical protein
MYSSLFFVYVKLEPTFNFSSFFIAIADAMATNGMKDAGYKYIFLDDCWAG